MFKFGAEIYGLSLPENNEIAMFNVNKARNFVHEEFHVDIRDGENLTKIIGKIEPDYIFHLAAQSLVIEAQINPLFTLETNVIGTYNLLNAAARASSNPVIVIITSDKVYRNEEFGNRFKENDHLGGFEIYSASKASAEIISEAFFHSLGKKDGLRVATARAGNVIGGGDWSENRIIPDFFRALSTTKCLKLRNPKSIRPWQHVLDPIYGYIQLGERLASSSSATFEKFNFGPDPQSERSVSEICLMIGKSYPDFLIENETANETDFEEARTLKIDSSLARTEIGWQPKLSLEQTLIWVNEWYGSFLMGDNMFNVTNEQINRYLDL